MQILNLNDSYYEVKNNGTDMFLFKCFPTKEVLPADYENYDDFYSDIIKYYIDDSMSIDCDFNCVCIEPLTFSESLAIEDWVQAFKTIISEFKGRYKKVLFKLMVIGNKFSYVCSKANLNYITNVFVEIFDEEYGMKNQEFLIYSE